MSNNCPEKNKSLDLVKLKIIFEASSNCVFILIILFLFLHLNIELGEREKLCNLHLITGKLDS